MIGKAARADPYLGGESRVRRGNCNKTGASSQVKVWGFITPALQEL